MMNEYVSSFPDVQWLLLSRSGSALRGKRLSLRTPQSVISQSVVPQPVVQPAVIVEDGSRFRVARRRLGCTQRMLADFAQVGVATIKRAERGERLRSDTVAQICQVFSDRYRRAVGPEELGLQMSWGYRVRGVPG